MPPDVWPASAAGAAWRRSGWTAPVRMHQAVTRGLHRTSRTDIRPKECAREVVRRYWPLVGGGECREGTRGATAVLNWLRNCNSEASGWALRLSAGGRHAKRYLSDQSRWRRCGRASAAARPGPLHDIRCGQDRCPRHRGGVGGARADYLQFARRGSSGGLARAGGTAIAFCIRDLAARTVRVGGARQVCPEADPRGRSGAASWPRRIPGSGSRGGRRGRDRTSRWRGGESAIPGGRTSLRFRRAASCPPEAAGNTHLPGPGDATGPHLAGYDVVLATGPGWPAPAPPG